MQIATCAFEKMPYLEFALPPPTNFVSAIVVPGAVDRLKVLPPTGEVAALRLTPPLPPPTAPP